MKIVITKKDVDEAGPFTEPKRCPMAKALQKALKDKNIETCISSVFKRNNDVWKSPIEIGVLNPGFSSEDYDSLLEGKTDEFVTEYTPI